ncbi:uncharacterized protein METZ01_LOCUS175193 [marine metagenome]|uniref:Phosphoribulokinase/uridine kinase domain-containing protein n=1 Tax=marine metagenome TaxID=408172 RepID=A0A382C915_9ZZZZ
MAEKLNIEELTKLIQHRAASGQGGMTFVSIDGPSGAGKSTLAAVLQSLLPGATVVHVDDFYSDEGVDPAGSMDIEDACDEYVDWLKLLELVLEPLKDGENGYYQTYDWVAQKPDIWVTVEPRGVLIVEGVYAMRPELRDVYDVKVFVDTPPEIRFNRLGKRSDNPLWVERWAEAEVWYNTNIKPIDYADVIVSGE